MRITCSSILLVVVLLVSINVRADSHKQIVGATEVIQVGKENLSFKARVDTGAKTSSIHAEDIEVDLSGDPRGKSISFYLVNEKGESKKVETLVDSVVEVRTSERSERRYKVPLLMKWNDSRKTVLLTLNDRKGMKYRLLLGRNWLHGDFIVDVDKNNED
ncbi:MAG: RimK/LysX family protein [Gammaproteobacteria bacterium]|nr:RimK/LysX family protein [Gammaproteobacteria bacterium]MDH3413754.1 RimK/LysX family protein [Gammaproteobacteria bacterium]